MQKRVKLEELIQPLKPSEVSEFEAVICLSRVYLVGTMAEICNKNSFTLSSKPFYFKSSYDYNLVVFILNNINFKTFSNGLSVQHIKFEDIKNIEVNFPSEKMLKEYERLTKIQETYKELIELLETKKEMMVNARG